MKVTLIIWISAIILQEVEPGTLARIPRDVANLKSSIHTQYEANYKQKGPHGNDSFSTIKGNQEILHENCNDTWNEFAEKCAGLVKDLIASLANTISSSPGDATNLQLHIKNNFTHVDTSHKRNCLKRPPTCLSNLNFSSLFNNETGNILNKPNTEAPISILTTLKKPESCEEDSPTPIQLNGEEIKSNNTNEDPKRSQQGSSLADVNSSHMNPEEAEALTGPQINNNRRQVNQQHPEPTIDPTFELEEEKTTSGPEDSTAAPSTSSRLPVIPLNSEALSSSPHISFDPNDMSLEVSAVPPNPPHFIRNTSPIPYSVDDLGNSANSHLDQSLSNEDMSSRGPKGLPQSYSSSEDSNEFFSNSVDRKNSPPPKYTSQQESSEEEKYHTYLPPQSLVGEPMNGDSQQLHEEFESEENPDRKVRGHAQNESNEDSLEKVPHPPIHDHHPPLPVISHDPSILPTTAPPVLVNPASPPILPSEQSKEPSPLVLSADHTPDLSKTNASPHSISHQDPLQQLKSHASHPPDSLITDDSTPPIIAPVSQPETQPGILPAQISNVPLAKEVSHDDYLNGNQPPASLESVPSSESTEPQILSFPQSSNKPLEASNHLSQPITEPPVTGGELVSSEESPNYGSPENESPAVKSAPPSLLLIPAPDSKEGKSHFNKPSSSAEHLEIVPNHDSHNIHHQEHPHPPPPPPPIISPHSPHLPHHHHPGSTIPVEKDDDDKKVSLETKPVAVIESEEKPSSPKRELADPHPPHPKIELVPVPPPKDELPPPLKEKLVPVLLPEKELPPPPPPPPPKVELVPVPVHEKELPPPPPPPPPKVELVPVPVHEKELPPHPPPPPPKVELVPVPVHEKELPPPPPPPPPKVELVPVPVHEKELPPPPPPKVELVPVPVHEKELPPPPPPPPPKVELVPVPVHEKELPPPPPPPPPKTELIPVPVPEKELPPPPPPKVELVPVPVHEKELPPPPPPPPPKVELVPVPVHEKELPPPPPKVELVPVPVHEKELPPPPPPPPPKVELVAVPVPEKELPPPPPPKIELAPVPPPKDELPPPPKEKLVPVLLPEKELPPPPPKEIELVPVPVSEKELPPPPRSKVEIVPFSLPEKELPPPKIELVPVHPPEKELPPPPPPKEKLVPLHSLEQNEIPPDDLKDDKPFADMPWSQHMPHPPHQHPPHHPPPHHPHHHHHPHHKKEDDDSSSLEEEKATTFQTTSVDPTPPESSLSYPPFFMPNPTSQAPPPLTIPNSEAYPLIPSPTTFETVPATKQEDNEDDEEDCCTCESCLEDEESGVKCQRTSACQDLEQARRELKAIFDKIKKKLKCGRKTQRTTTITT